MPRKILIFVLGILFGGGVWMATNVMRVRSGEAPPAVEVREEAESAESEEEFGESQNIEEGADLEAKQELKSQ
ncbi:MAG: hypothetical protein IJP85_03290 [Synergistaceae bacterium]|nr:hypothetical protein [Synergistaceae bacterium]MBQ7528663.1 hypothetical protein [bacterium]